MEINLKVEVSYFNRGKGGQNVNKNKNGVKLIHRDSGITVSIIDTRLRKQNMKKALEIMAKRLSEYYTEKRKEELTKQELKKKSDEIIRTYNEKRNTCKDHIINKVYILDDGITLSPSKLLKLIKDYQKKMN